MIEIEFKPDIEHIQQDLLRLSNELRDKIIYRATVQAAKPYKDLMRSLAPKETGALRDTIGHAKINDRQKGRLSIPTDQAAVLVGPVRRVTVRTVKYSVPDGEGGTITFNVARKGHRSRIANILEGGARPHKINAKRGEFLAVHGIGFVKVVNHPGIKALRFMERSWSSAGNRPNDLFYESLARHLDRVEAKTAA